MTKQRAAVDLRFDEITIGFHWITAALVQALFSTAMAWTYLPRDWGLRALGSVHASLGIALAAAVVARLIWRLTAGRQVETTGHRAVQSLARLVHVALYGLLLLQVALGLALPWLSGDALSFFGLFELPSQLTENRDLANRLENLHGIVAWTLMILVAGHAAAALFHHYIFKDGVLRRMLPLWPARAQEAN